MNNTSIFYLIWLKFRFQKKFEKEIVFKSSVLAWIRIRIVQKCWIRIRIVNPDPQPWPELSENFYQKPSTFQRKQIVYPVSN
jgi:hypothetical protein